MGEIMGEVMGEIMSEVMGEIMGEVMGEIMGEIMGEVLGEVMGEIMFYLFSLFYRSRWSKHKVKILLKWNHIYVYTWFLRYFSDSFLPAFEYIRSPWL
jgi:hypothetical protein